MSRFLLALAAVLAAAFSLTAQAETVTVGSVNQWYAFDVDDTVSLSGGLEWIEVDGGEALSFALSLDQAAWVTIVDAGFGGDTFEVLSNGVRALLTAPAIDTYPDSRFLDFDAALADPDYSSGRFLLQAGMYTITGRLLRSAQDDLGNPLNATIGALRVAPVPLPATALLLLAGSGLLGLVTRRRRVIKE